MLGPRCQAAHIFFASGCLGLSLKTGAAGSCQKALLEVLIHGGRRQVGAGRFFSAWPGATAGLQPGAWSWSLHPAYLFVVHAGLCHPCNRPDLATSLVPTIVLACQVLRSASLSSPAAAPYWDRASRIWAVPRPWAAALSWPVVRGGLGTPVPPTSSWRTQVPSL